MAREGIVRSVAGQDYGFVHDIADNLESFIHPDSTYPPGETMRGGDKVEYEREQKPDGNWKVIGQITVKSRDNPIPPVPRRTSRAAVQELEVDAEFWDPHPWIPQGQRKTMQGLPTFVIVTRGGKALLNEEVELVKVEDQEKDEKTSTVKNGAFFRIVMPREAKTCKFAVRVQGKIYNLFWPKDRKDLPKKKIETTTGEKKKATIEIVNPPRDPDPSTGLFLVNVITRKDGKPVDLKFTVTSEPVAVEIRQSQNDGIVAVTEYISVKAGQYQLYIQFNGNFAKVTFHLEDGLTASVHLVR